MITLLTASLPERRDFLAEAIASVEAQTLHPDAHLVGVDHRREGAAVVYNRLAKAADSDWIAFLDDDDLLLEDHISQLTAAAERDDADVIYAGCESIGPHHFTNYNRPFDAQRMKRMCLVPITGAIRWSLFGQIGGFPTNERSYDWRMWQRALAAGGRLRQLNVITWQYRRHDANHSHGEVV